MPASRRRRRSLAEMNVVPYIDVMFVLLIIFMVTAPLLTLGVDIELPQSVAEPIDVGGDPVIVSVTAAGEINLEIGGTREQVDDETLVNKVSAFLRQNPDVAVHIGGDTRVDYGRVYHAMALVQQAGATRIGLISLPLRDGD